MRLPKFFPYYFVSSTNYKYLNSTFNGITNNPSYSQTAVRFFFVDVATDDLYPIMEGLKVSRHHIPVVAFFIAAQNRSQLPDVRINGGVMVGINFT